MDPKAARIAQDYEEILRDHLRGQGEETLRQVYELGRHALAEGMGILGLVALQNYVFRCILSESGTSEELLRTLEAWQILLVESLTVYEMTHQNSRESSAAWRLLNERLEGEAKRIAHALHDEAGQLLAAAYIPLDELVPELPPRMQRRLLETRGILDRIAEELRRLSHELRPTILDNLGLVPALEFLAQGVSRRGGFKVLVQGAIEDRLSPAVETALYRVVQEALSNVSRHSRARNVGLELRREGSEVICTVRDDGVGFDPRKAQSPGRHTGLGLIGMRERLAAVGGSLTFSTVPGQGATLKFSVPLEHRYVDTDSAR